MKILTGNEKRQVVENADYIFKALDTAIDLHNKQNEQILEAAMKTIEIISIVGGNKALTQSWGWKKYMASFEERLKQHLDRQIMQGEGKK